MDTNITLDLLVNPRKQKKINMGNVNKINTIQPKKIGNTLNNLKILGNNIVIHFAQKSLFSLSP